MPARQTLLSVGERKEVNRISFKSLGVSQKAYKLLGKTPFARDPSVYGRTVTLTTGDGFYLILHFPVKRVGGEEFVITEDGLIPVSAGGVSVALNSTFEIKRNKLALKNIRKAHLKLKTGYSKNIITIVSFTTLKPVALTLGIIKKHRSVKLPPKLPSDLLYSVKDRDAIEEAGIILGMGLKEVSKDAGVSMLERVAIYNHKNIQTVYRARFCDAGDKDTERLVRLIRVLRDPLLVELMNNLVNVLPSLAGNNGYTVEPPLLLDFLFKIPLNSVRGGFDVRVLDSRGKSLDFTIPNPNPNGRKKYIKAKTLLFYAPANKFIRHKTGGGKRKPVVDVLSFQHLVS